MQERTAFPLRGHQEFELLPNRRLIAKLSFNETGLRSSTHYCVEDENIPSYDAIASFFSRERTCDRHGSARLDQTVFRRSKARN
jgi:hypothetical protein